MDPNPVRPFRNPSGGIQWWTTEEAKAKFMRQVSPSGCGPTAAIDVLRILGIQADPQEVQQAAPARLRDYDAPLMKYLTSRALAGTTHLDLIEAVAQLSGAQVRGTFFAPHHLTVGSQLGDWLAQWVEAGAVPVLTLNLFLQGNDAWHHQVVYGVEPPSSPSPAMGNISQGGALCAKGWRLLLLNPLCEEPAERVMQTLATPPFMIIPRDHVEAKLASWISGSPDAQGHSMEPGISSAGKDYHVLSSPSSLLSSSTAAAAVAAAAAAAGAVVGRNSDAQLAAAVGAADAKLSSSSAAAAAWPTTSGSSGLDDVMLLCSSLQTTPPWSDFSVGEQIMGVLHGMLSGGSNGLLREIDKGASAGGRTSPASASRGKNPEHGVLEGGGKGASAPRTGLQRPAAAAGRFSRFGDVVIPWGGLSGVTLFACEGSVAHAWLRAKEAGPGVRVEGGPQPSVGPGAAGITVALPLYRGKVARVLLDLSPPTSGLSHSA